MVFFTLSWALVSSATAAEHPAQKLVEKAVGELLNVMREDGDRIQSDTDFRQQKLEEIVVPHLDFDLMTKRIIN